MKFPWMWGKGGAGSGGVEVERDVFARDDSAMGSPRGHAGKGRTLFRRNTAPAGSLPSPSGAPARPRSDQVAPAMPPASRKVKRVATQFPVNVGKTSQQDERTADKDHLCVLVHGLGGGPWDWTSVGVELDQCLGDSTNVHVHVSSVNSFVRTFDGIDICGARLAEEVKEVVQANPGLRYLTIVGHSLGGLISRYAIGSLFCEETGTLFGLRPRHFVSIVSPHLGCDPQHSTENAVPFLGFLGSLPLVGVPLRHVARAAAAPGAKVLYRRTGSQLFLRDKEPHNAGLPLVFQLACNGLSEEIIDEVLEEFSESEEAHRGAREARRNLLPFGPALAAFESRVAYANVTGDHMVSWPNASIRKLGELPKQALETEEKGIVHESFSTEHKVKRKLTLSKQSRVQDIMIESLQKLSWKRVDVKLNASATALPHNYIQARPPKDEGLSVTRHLAKLLNTDR